MDNNLSNIEQALKRAELFQINCKILYLLNYFKDSLDDLRQVISILISDSRYVLTETDVRSNSYFYISIDKLIQINTIYITQQPIENRIEVKYNINSRTKLQNPAQVLEIITTHDISINIEYKSFSLQEYLINDLKQLDKKNILRKIHQFRNVVGYTSMMCSEGNMNSIGLKNLLCSVGEVEARDILMKLTYGFYETVEHTLRKLNKVQAEGDMYFYTPNTTNKEIIDIRWSTEEDIGKIYHKAHQSLVISIPAKYLVNYEVEALQHATIYCKVDELVLHYNGYRKCNQNGAVTSYKNKVIDGYGHDGIENISNSHIFISNNIYGMALYMARNPDKYKWVHPVNASRLPVELNPKFNKLKCIFNKEHDEDACNMSDLLFWGNNGN